MVLEPDRVGIANDVVEQDLEHQVLVSMFPLFFFFLISLMIIMIIIYRHYTSSQHRVTTRRGPQRWRRHEREASDDGRGSR